MKRAKKISALILGIIYLFFSSGLALADTRPYFRAYGADIASGGWFNAGASSCSPSASTFQAPDYSGPSNLYKGGVMGYGKNNGSGAGSQFGALALGLIEGNSGAGEPYGFTSGSSGYNKLSFANFSSLSATNFWGGFLEGSNAHQAAHCLPDYYGTKQNSPQSISSDSTTYTNATASGQYLVKPPSGLLSANSTSPIAKSKNITVFVDGNVLITSNVTYAARNTYTADTAPKFALVVKGSIFIAPNVTQLDGLYIAQPNLSLGNAVTADSGVIWTCHQANNNVPTAQYVSTNCRSKLTFNGAVIAKQVNLLKANGDVASAAAGEDSGSGNIAEVFNFTPEMVVGGCFFNCGGNTYKIESLISLPPVF